MQFIGLLVQIALVIAWYVVPAFATLPWFVIFLPMLIGVASIVVMLTIFGLGMLATWAAWKLS